MQRLTHPHIEPVHRSILGKFIEWFCAFDSMEKSCVFLLAKDRFKVDTVGLTKMFTYYSFI